MIKSNKNTKSRLKDFFKKSLLILIIFFSQNNIVLGANNNWIEISKTPSGIQYLDKNNINYKDEKILEIKTKYLKLEPNTSKELEENNYVMRINCSTLKFKDISINGKKNLRAKWQSSDNDKLIDDVISYSCKNV